MKDTRLTLAAARKTGRLQDFIAQEEASGIEPVDQDEFVATLAAVIKPPRSEDRTSRSPLRDGSAGT